MITSTQVGNWLLRHGVDPTTVSRKHGVRIVMPAMKDDRAYLQVTVFVLNERGKRFIDEGTGDVATETRMIPLDSFPG